MTQADFTDITIVLDRSGSMTTVEFETKTGFDKFVQKHKEAPGRALLTMVQFDTDYEFIYRAVPIADVKPLVFEPRGMTALLDAVGRAIDETGIRLATMNEDDRPGKVLFVILTDGLENSSFKYTKSKINEMIKNQTDVWKWEFVYLGANQDAIAEGRSLGIKPGNIANYAATPQGTNAAMEVLTNGSIRYRGMKEPAADFFSQAERQEIESHIKQDSK